MSNPTIDDTDSMQSSKPRNPRQTACTECSKRKQKCKPGKGNLCYSCSRRWPPVRCVKPLEPQRTDPVSSSHKADCSKDEHTRYGPGSLARSATHNVLGPPNSLSGYVSAAHAANIAPSHRTLQNGELFYYFMHTLSPTFFSIDPENAPPVFFNKILPWLIQCPVMPEISALISLTFKHNIIGKESVKCAQALAAKGYIYTLVNKFLAQDINRIWEQAIQVVMFFSAVESVWGDGGKFWVHLKGIKNMLDACGGIDRLKGTILKEMLIVADYQVAIMDEQDLFFHQPLPYQVYTSSIAVPYPETFNSPLLDFSAKFVNIYPSLDLDTRIGAILDDVRLMTLSVTTAFALGKSARPGTCYSKLSSAHERIRDLPTIQITHTSDEIDLIYEVCRMAALAYSFSIESHSPLSEVLSRDAAWLEEFRSKLLAVSRSRWQRIPGVFLWVLLVVAPSTQDDSRSGVYLGMKLSAATSYIDIQDHDLAVGILKAFWTVQRWLARSRVEEAHDMKATPGPGWSRRLQHRLKG